MIALISVLAFWVTGACILAQFKLVPGRRELAAFAFPVGIGIYTFLVFLFGAVGISFQPIVLFTLWSLVLLVFGKKLIIFLTTKPASQHVKISLPHQLLRIAGTIICVIMISITSIYNYYWPPTAFDSLTMYDFRGRIFASEKKLALLNQTYLGSYPLLTSLAHTVVYVFGGTNPSLIYSAFYISSLLSLYILLSPRSPWLATLATALLATVPEYARHSIIAYTNLPYAYFFSFGLILLLESFKGKFNYLYLAALLLALAAWTRPGHFPFLIISILLAFITSSTGHRLKAGLVILTGYIAISFPWYIYQKLVGFSSEGLIPFGWTVNAMPILVKRLIIMIGFWLLRFASPAYAGFILWPALLLTLTSLIFWKQTPQNIKLTLLTLFLIFAVWVAIALPIGLKPQEGFDWQVFVDTSFGRLALIFVPLMVYFSATATYALIYQVPKANPA